nr:cupin domain-containing protein [uncultured Shinella sp.]
MTGHNPKSMTCRKAGEAMPSPEGISYGRFWYEDLLPGGADGDLAAIRADLPPGVVTRWHSHPQGQFLYVLSGLGLVQAGDGPVRQVRAGDAVWFAPGERHRHGAVENSMFSYISVQAWQDGRNVDWLEEKTENHL